MAINGQFVDIHYLLDELEHRFGFDDLSFNDVAEDMWMASALIAEPDSFDRKFADVVIADYRGTIPTDFYNITDGAVIEKNSNIPLVESLDLMDRFSTDETILAETDALDYTYKIIGNYIYTGLEDGMLTMSYRAFPSENGLPLIPNTAKSIRYLVNYVGERIAFKLLLSDKLSERKYEIIRQEALFSAGAYKTASKIPSLSVMERLKNMHINILRNPNNYDNQFQTLGARSNIVTTPINTDGLNNTLDMTLTATSTSQTEFDRTYEISSTNLDTVKALGNWVATLAGTDYTLTYNTDVSYNSTTDIITYISTNYGNVAISDTIVFTHNIQ